MEVRIADKKGFCFGVEHAIELAQQMLHAGKKVYCLGPLIHNKQVVDRLAKQGLIVVDRVEDIPADKSADSQSESPTVLIRSHGCSPDKIHQVAERGFQLADATCILVKRAQKLVSTLHEQGYRVVVIGDPDHPEIQGAVGYAPDVIVVKNEKDLDKLPEHGKLAVISQTTYSAQDFGRIVGLIATQGYEEMKVVNTICRETALRQESAVELCRQVDVMFVIGSHHSANTGELAQLCRRQGVETFHLQNWQEFNPDYIRDKKTAGVTAGASTPDWIIQEFVDNLKSL